ncbi:hypothetical protein ACOMHN_061899 [Nucella lapillus]
MTEKVGKRARKANFSAEEVIILLEELQVEHVTLFSSHSATITSEMKKEIWQRITSKVNACGVAVRTLTDLKEKWRALKASVLNKKRDEAKTGGGPAPAPVPYEEVILSIIGDKSNLFSGVTGKMTTALPASTLSENQAMCQCYQTPCIRMQAQAAPTGLTMPETTLQRRVQLWQVKRHFHTVHDSSAHCRLVHADQFSSDVLKC